MSFNSAKYRTERQTKPDDGKTSKFPQSREESSEQRLQLVIENDRIDQKYGFERFKEPYERIGFLINMHSGEILDEDKRLVAAVDYYFIEEDGSRFKVSYPFKPYFYILTRREFIQEISQYLMKKHSGVISSIEVVKKEDLDLPNHLLGLKQYYLKISFFNQNDLMKVRREIMPRIKKNKEREKSNNFYTEMLTNALAAGVENNIQQKITTDHLENILDIREHDIPFHTRVSIDLRICCGSWYTVKGKGSGCVGGDTPTITLRPDIIDHPEPIVLAFDIETTKLPLKFPDANTDQIMMISYMIDGQGYLITNREIISADIEDFEYTPKPEYEGRFTIHNAASESALISQFFNHIVEVRPHIIVTYNGDSFDWPFVEARAAAHDLDMRREIGFGRGASGPNADNSVYCSRPAMHMDCFCWVKRDSYLPMGSMGLKAVTKAKLRYDPVEVDPEQMCPMAISDPIALSNYSVSDAVATYYLYIQYVHPFIFALSTIIPCEPDEVLRKGSGTLCEALLMVKATEADIIYPNKQQSELNKMTVDGHVLHQETYVGGHVEALESGVFRADIPCRFRIDSDAISQLIAQLPATLHHAIQVEEGVPLDQVTNLDEITADLTTTLRALQEHPMRLERPLIYHLDVAAMYPNIILTNRLQPYASVTETICAACDYNKVNALCKRKMTWMSREEYMPANRNEYQRIQQQLETERFPSQYPGGAPRAFHQLTREEQANLEKTRLAIYCRKVYKKQKITRMEEKCTTICQKEHSFYVDTVRAFRDRRYEYKGMSKKAKFDVLHAIKGGDASEIKSAKNREVLFDSLQLAHKCILNSFYGYVMRRGARWHSMEMGGIVCYTGAHIIMRAREIIDKIGRPLELDTDGIWCILPVSFPENVTVRSTHPKKPKFNISYPNAVLNAMVKQYFTNDQYHELVDKDTLKYELRLENTIFFEVDGPYKAMVLPASKEEGKKLKKRYAVFNFDGTLAELKGFEVKRRGELQLIKNFQSSVFEAFLKGDSLESCYAAVAHVANFWLDVLFAKGGSMPDDELFDLISENRSMSKKLEEYGSQKSTSISTAKRLAEFLGDQMVKDAGLACKYVVARKPIGAPVTERAIPMAIFQTEEAVQKHYLRKWLKDSSLCDGNIRDIIDWNYYIERLGGSIQKIITIPAAMQGISNPVPRIRHPDWLHKKILEKNDIYKQRRIDDMFSKIPKVSAEMEQGNDIEDLVGMKNIKLPQIATVIKRKRKNDCEFDEEELAKSWKEILGNPPAYGSTKEERVIWVEFHKKKWRFQHMQKNGGNKRSRHSSAVVRTSTNTLGSFLQRSQRSLLTNTWQILQISSTATPGEFRLWALVQSELHLLKLIIPRQFYANIKTPKDVEEGALFKKCNRTLPRARKVHFLYQYNVPEEVFQEHGKKLYLEQASAATVSGVYETQTPPLFRALVQLGCVCRVTSTHCKPPPQTINQEQSQSTGSYQLDQLEMSSVAKQPYLPNGALKRIYLYHHRAPTGKRQMFAVFLTPIKKAVVIVVDSVKTNMMPNMATMYASERIVKLDRNGGDDLHLPEMLEFDVRVETDLQNVYKIVQKTLKSYKGEKNGPTLLAIQAVDEIAFLQSKIANLIDFPIAQIHIQGVEDLYSNLEWQRNGARSLLRHYLNHERVLDLMVEQCRYLYVPIGNMAADSAILGADIFYARNLLKHNHVLWASTMDRPDLGGAQENDARLLAESQESSSEVCNQVGWYSSICVELDIDSLAITTLLQSHHVTDMEGTSVATAFDQQQSIVASVADVAKCSIAADNAQTISTYDESTRCADAFRILRTMASSWMRDISLHRNVYADFQVVHFYRWLRSSKSLLYDPALLRTLQNLMKKLFMQLVAEFKRLGCKVIYANFNKIIVCSKKRTVKDAIENIEFVVTSIRNKELFHSLDITYRQCWEQLVWLDTANYAGIQGEIPKDVEEPGNQADNEVDSDQEREDDNQEEDDENQPVVVMNWNIAESLPETAQCRASFNAIIAGYINAVHNQLINQEQSSQCARNQTISTQSDFGLSTYESVLDFAKELLNGEISQNLFRIVERIKERLPKVEKGRSTALDFINALCHVFSLDPALDDAVQHMKSNLLKLIGVSEFCEETEFKDRSVSYVVPQVICRACNHCRDLDIGRDAHCNICPLCRTPYNMDLIESFLLDTVTRKLLAYNLQDLQCTKCAQIKLENIISRCHCAGDFIGLISRDELIKLFETFGNLAQTFEMPSLKESVDKILMLV